MIRVFLLIILCSLVAEISSSPLRIESSESLEEVLPPSKGMAPPRMDQMTSTEDDEPLSNEKEGPESEESNENDNNKRRALRAINPNISSEDNGNDPDVPEGAEEEESNEDDVIQPAGKSGRVLGVVNPIDNASEDTDDDPNEPEGAESEESQEDTKQEKNLK